MKSNKRSIITITIKSKNNQNKDDNNDDEATRNVKNEKTGYIYVHTIHVLLDL